MRNSYMKYQNPSIHGSEDRVCIKKHDEQMDEWTSGWMDNLKAICPFNFFKVGSIINEICVTLDKGQRMMLVYQVSTTLANRLQRRFLPYMGMVAILVMWPGSFEQIFIHSPFPRRLHMKFKFDWHSGFWEDVWRMWMTMTEACLYYKLTWANNVYRCKMFIFQQIKGKNFHFRQ